MQTDQSAKAGTKERIALAVLALPTLLVSMVVFGVIFFRRQKKMTEPLIHLDLFKIPLYRVALVSLPILLFMWAGIFVFVGQYLQLVLGMTPLAAGLWTLPGALASTVVCATTDALTKVFPKPVLLVTGLLLMGISMLLFVELNTGLLLMVIANIVLACGCGMGSSGDTFCDCVCGWKDVEVRYWRAVNWRLVKNRVS